MILTITTCIVFCTMDISPIKYKSLDRCIQQGTILAGMQKVHLPRMKVPLTGNVIITCEESNGKIHIFTF